MVEGRRRLCLLTEPGCLFARSRAQYLDRDVALESCVARLVNDSHSAATKLGKNLISLKCGELRFRVIVGCSPFPTRTRVFGGAVGLDQRAKLAGGFAGIVKGEDALELGQGRRQFSDLVELVSKGDRRSEPARL